MAVLYGDGTHDDREAIQELLDTQCDVMLPMPAVCYSLGGTLRLRSNQSLHLPENAVIRMLDGADCLMLECRGTPEEKLHDIVIEGGIWDDNNLGQSPNPLWVRPAGEKRGNEYLLETISDERPRYTGYMFSFKDAEHFRLSGMTFKDPINFCVTIDRCSHFAVEHIRFDFNHGNPVPVNMDGIHLNGNCHYALIRDLRGACYDDTVALNADEGTCGPISHIEIDGIEGWDSHSAVRLLTVKNPVEHITIRNVRGSYYQYAIGFTKFYPGKTTGWYDDIRLENIHVAKAERYSIYQKDGSEAYPLLYFEPKTVVRGLVITDLMQAML